MERKKSIIMIVLFFVLIGLPYLLWSVVGKHIDTSSAENRNLAEFPTITRETVSAFPSEFESYVNDHLPFRNQLIRTNSLIRYHLGESSSPQVIIGEKGWLFYTGDNSIGHYKGTNLLNEGQLQQIADNLVRSRDKLAEEGREFVLFIAPNKNRIYAEYMPDYYGEPAETYAARQIVDYLRANTDIRVVFPVEELTAAAKAHGDELLFYFKTDTHWNSLGAYVGVGVLMKELGIDLPAYYEIGVVEEVFRGGDLAKMLNLASKIDAGRSYAPQTHVKSEIVEETRGSIVSYHNSISGLDQRTIMFYRDSFMSHMLPIINSQFAENKTVHALDYTNELVRQENPDIFVFETVERYAASRLLSFIYE